MKSASLNIDHGDISFGSGADEGAAVSGTWLAAAGTAESGDGWAGSAGTSVARGLAISVDAGMVDGAVIGWPC
jgi:hypothetical protein